MPAWHPQERRAFLYLPLLALLVSIVVELFNHKTFTEGPASFWRFVSDEPLAFLVDVLIVLVTLSPAFFFRRRAFWCALVSFLWLVAGGVNGFILLNRMTPFTVADLTVFETGLDTVPNYLSTGYIILLIGGAAGSGRRPGAAVLEGAPQPPAGADPDPHRRGRPGGVQPPDGRRLRPGLCQRGTCPTSSPTWPLPMRTTASPTASSRPG